MHGYLQLEIILNKLQKYSAVVRKSPARVYYLHLLPIYLHVFWDVN